jgi:ferrous iron transport protein B
MDIALVGNPNVGKSLLFSRITGIGAIVSNYPGTTVEFEEAKVVKGKEILTVYDLPGTYSLAGASEDEVVAGRLLSEKRLDCVIAVADATRIEQSLVLVFQLIELGYRVIVALNFMDLARKRFMIDLDKLSDILHIPVVGTVAITGEGVDELVNAVVSGRVALSGFVVRYDSHIESIVSELSKELEGVDIGLPQRGAILKLLEGDEYFVARFPTTLRKRAAEVRAAFREEHLEDIEVHINRDRYGEAGNIVSEIIGRLDKTPTLADRISELTLRPRTGILIVLVVLAGVFLSVVYLGGMIETGLLYIYHSVTGNSFDDLASFLGGKMGAALSEGIDLSLQAILSIVIPYILVFYIILGILEDSGYLPRVVALLDGVMHKIGLHGRAIIPMMVGIGCNVPAILATRVIESRRERLILATIIIMAVPCSAQVAIVLGTVGRFGGVWYAILLFLILLSILLVLGRLLHKAMRFEPSSLAIEIPKLSIPQPKNVLYKTYVRVKDFFVIAFPILLAGSIALELLAQYGILDTIVTPLAPFTTGFLGLPAVIIIALIFGVLRKEMSMQMLIVLFGTVELSTVLTPDQLFVFALIMVTYMPCIAAFTVMVKEFGLKDTLKVTTGSIVLAFTLGGAAHFILGVF